MLRHFIPGARLVEPRALAHNQVVLWSSGTFASVVVPLHSMCRTGMRHPYAPQPYIYRFTATALSREPRLTTAPADSWRDLCISHLLLHRVVTDVTLDGASHGRQKPCIAHCNNPYSIWHIFRPRSKSCLFTNVHLPTVVCKLNLNLPGTATTHLTARPGTGQTQASRPALSFARAGWSDLAIPIQSRDRPSHSMTMPGGGCTSPDSHL